jgi:enoyl-[acyl-carrier protein] reductase I
MAQAKATLESITRSYGYIYGKKNKVRVNTISQSPTKTTSTFKMKEFKKLYEYSNKKSPLGNASALDCANYIVFMFSDLSKMITMQNLIHDGGFSLCG